MHRLLTAALAAFALTAGAALAQEDYPTDTITMVVPFSAGGPTDTVARLIAESMSKTLGQQIIVENVAGAGGTLGARRVAQAEPDGYTLLLHHIGMSTSPTLYRNLPFDPKTDFAPIGLVTEVPMTIVARPDFPAEDLQGLVNYVKENKDTVTIAHAGTGAASQLCTMLFTKAIETPLTQVPYKGTGPAMTDLLGGQVDVMCDQTTNTTSQIKGGKVKAYATLADERLEALPDLATAKEAGLEGLDLSIWHGLYAPADTPQPIIDKLSQALQAALGDENVISRFAELGTEPVAAEAATPAALQERLASEIDRWAPIIQEAGVYAE